MRSPRSLCVQKYNTTQNLPALHYCSLFLSTIIAITSVQQSAQILTRIIQSKMVRIQVKHHDNDCGELQFLYDCETSSTIEEITKDLTEIASLQLQIQCLGFRLLPPLSVLLHKNPQAIALHRAVSEATSYASKEQVLHGRPLSSRVLKDHIKIIEKEFAKNRNVLDFPESNLTQVLSDLELLHEDSIQLWWGGKQFMMGKTLCDYVGKNEKTKIVVGLQSHISNCCPLSDSASAGVSPSKFMP
ncbi:hypothetical protein M9H77_28689 [Catharanthus roseus]|uniref:Uncharacterized protein n=1 Tax=Catharanthus roseus TaxID=4058 RepID=A0ACC0AK70_CATRO|nr:hypothetical protein M9H77_28689 [Catharanthus roseus]